MPSNKPVTVLRLDNDVKYKLQYIADNNFRTINAEVTMLILKHIAEYESANGPIRVPGSDSD